MCVLLAMIDDKSIVLGVLGYFNLLLSNPLIDYPRLKYLGC